MRLVRWSCLAPYLFQEMFTVVVDHYPAAEPLGIVLRHRAASDLAPALDDATWMLDALQHNSKHPSLYQTGSTRRAAT